ncbi:kelch-like protein 26 [Mizuhopecten yessoensis]|uniref:Kelch-like protein 26 n=1 Tax=Mizuhopecten yessoensis TaxID=6573 RepID=A0A210Q8K6_MIZYE|nr:kelch-like protein 26 [Mizuhopecten yessoensis]OWF45064.1 Kelch-like protein 26 [Mizuhopecten yessoensis]
MVRQDTPGSTMPDQVKFEATDHGHSVLAGLKHLRDKQQLFDVILTAQNQKFPAHRVVLASCCQYFRAMFTDGLMECQQTEIQLNGVTATGIHSLIDFAYTSKILLNFDNIEDILLSANHIQMLPVLKACSDFLKDHLSIENCANMANWADLFSLTELKVHILKFMCKNFVALSYSSEFLQIPASLLRNLFFCNYPVDCSEGDLLSAVVMWICHQPEVRLPQVSPILDGVHWENISSQDINKLSQNVTFEKLLEISMSMRDAISRGFPAEVCCLQKSGLLNTRGYRKALVCVGGFSPRSGMTNDLRYCMIGSRVWKTLTQIPHVQQCNFGHVVMNNILYVVGGCFNDNMQEIIHNYGFKYNPATHTWSSISQMRSERCRFFLAEAKGKLYAIGGDPSASNPLAEDAAPCECYNPVDDSWSPIQPMPINRSQHAGVAVGDFLYVSGGLQDIDEDTFSDFYKYDTNSDSWISLPPMLMPRADHTLFTHNGLLYVIGGWYEDLANQQRRMAANIDCFIEGENRWETVGAVPQPRLYATYSVVDDCVSVIGGWINGDYMRKAHTIQMYDLVTRNWTEEDSKQIKLGKHSVCTMYLPQCDNS